MSKETIEAKVRAAVAQSLEPGEQVQGVTMAQSGANPWLAYSFGAIGALILMKFWYLVLTDRRLIFMGGLKGAKRADVRSADPRSAAGIALWKPSGLWSKLSIRRADGSVTKLYINRRFRAEAAALVAALGAPAGGPPAR